MGAIFGQTHKLIALQHILSLLSHHAFCLCSLYLLNCYLFHEFGLVLATHHFCCRSLTVIFFFSPHLAVVYFALFFLFVAFLIGNTIYSSFFHRFLTFVTVSISTGRELPYNDLAVYSPNRAKFI